MIAFGATSTTDDLDGELTAGEGPAPNRSRLEAALVPFRGRLSQVPPDHSAVRVQGRRAYEVARAGERPVLEARTIVVHRLDLTTWDETDPTRPTATVEIACSAGTYIRAIARDLGTSLGCGAYLVALTRTQSGPFTLEQAHGPDAIRAGFAAGRGSGLLLPADAGLDAFPSISLGGGDLQALLRGQIVRAPTDGPGASDGDGDGDGARAPRRGHCRVRDANGRLAAIARLEGGRLHPEKVLLEPEPRT